jgi:HEPN domain-containing protein
MERKAELVRFWLQTSDLDFDAAATLFQSGKYPHALFFLHLSIEKLLKSYYIHVVEDYPPKTHNLVLIQKSSQLHLPDDLSAGILEINTFNQEARYPDEKMEFYKKCTFSFAQEFMKKGEEIRQWLKKKF